MSIESQLGGELEKPTCNLCNSSQSIALLSGTDVRRRGPGRFTVVRCIECGLVYTSPRPTPEAILAYYPEDYAPHGVREPDLAEGLYYRYFRLLGLLPGSRVLDVGCGGGSYLRFLESRGYQVAGTEVDAGLVEKLVHAGLEVRQGSLPEIPFPDQSFDAVTLWWVLEHAHDPLAALENARRVLRPGGMLVVSLQNFDSLGRRLFGAAWHHMDLPGHLYHFTPPTLTRLVERAGFRVDRLRQDLLAKDLAPSLGHWLGLRVSLDRAPLNLVALPFDLLGWVTRRAGLITAYATRPSQEEENRANERP